LSIARKNQSSMALSGSFAMRNLFSVEIGFTNVWKAFRRASEYISSVFNGLPSFMMRPKASAAASASRMPVVSPRAPTGYPTSQLSVQLGNDVGERKLHCSYGQRRLPRCIGPDGR
jgi:hypothetical protein